MLVVRPVALLDSTQFTADVMTYVEHLPPPKFKQSVIRTTYSTTVVIVTAEGAKGRGISVEQNLLYKRENVL